MSIDARVGYMALSILRNELLTTIKLQPGNLDYMIKYNRITLYFKGYTTAELRNVIE